MKTIATITFHSAYNFGSNLQAYALQEYVKQICPDCDYKIINLRSKKQKELYILPFYKKGLKNKIKSLFFLKYKKDLIKRNELYETFINKYLNLTKEYNSIDDIKKDEINYDYYISGSDQIWNLNAIDFDWSNFLEFAKKGKKISYAASFGPSLQNLSDNEKDRIKKDLQEYDYISVREEGSRNNVKNIANLDSLIHIDPTMLLTKDEWNKIIPTDRLIESEYILLYTLHNKKETFEIAKKISKELNIPIVVPKENLKIHIFYKFKHYYCCGPIEFLNLLRNAKLVLSSSFHGTVFSIIFKKPFLAINGEKDFRISTLLKTMNFLDRTV